MSNSDLLTREQEHALAVRYRDTGDVPTGQRLVKAHLRLVMKLAREYDHTGEAVADLVQEGAVGLLQALRKYDPDRGVRLSTYAAWWMRAYMLKYLLDNARLVRFKGPHDRKLFFRLKREKRDLEARGIAPTPEAIGKRLGVAASEVTAMEERLSHPELSLDATVGEDPSITWHERMQAPAESQPDITTEGAELHHRLLGELEAFGRELDDRDRKVFEERLVADEPKTLNEIGLELGLSRERVRQIELRLKQALRAQVRVHLGEAALAA